MATVVSEKMVWVGQQCRWFLEQGGMVPARPQEARGVEEALVEAVQRLTREELVALWMLALAWGGGPQTVDGRQ